MFFFLDQGVDGPCLLNCMQQEMKELATLADRNTMAEQREFWTIEMGQALREIQQVYDDKLEAIHAELETFYNLKVYGWW